MKEVFQKNRKRTQQCAFFSQKGFTLIEILTALFLLSVVLLAIPMGLSNSSRNALEDAMDDLDRAVRFASNEAILKNSIVRLRIDIEKTPAEYVVEIAPNSNFVIEQEIDRTKMSLKEIEEINKRMKKQNSQFNKAQEFENVSRGIEESVTIIGMANAENDKIKTDNPLNIYFYPSGEKDASLLLLSTNEEVAALEIRPFHDLTNSFFKTVSPNITQDELFDHQMSLARDMVDEWIKK